MPSAVGSALKSRSPLRKQCASKGVHAFTFSFSTDSAALPQVVMCWAAFAFFSPPSRLIYRVVIWAPRVRYIRQYEDIIPVGPDGPILHPHTYCVPSAFPNVVHLMPRFFSLQISCHCARDTPTYIVPLLVVFKRLCLPVLPQR